MLLAGSRVAVVAHQWQGISDKIATQVQALDEALPRNADVYSLFPEGAPQIDKRERAYAHLASYATINRNAHVSRTFAERSQQPLVSRVDELAALELRSASDGESRNPSALLLRVDLPAAPGHSTSTGPSVRHDLRQQRLLSLPANAQRVLVKRNQCRAPKSVVMIVTGSPW